MLRAVNLVTELPYALPGVVLAIAAILLFLKPLPIVHTTLYNTVWIIFFCYLARFLVLGLRPVMGGAPREGDCCADGPQLPRRDGAN